MTEFRSSRNDWQIGKNSRLVSGEGQEAADRTRKYSFWAADGLLWWQQYLLISH